MKGKIYIIKICYIYNPEVSYITSTCQDPFVYLAQFRQREKTKNTPIGSAMKKHGHLNFVVSILETVSNKILPCDLRLKKMIWILKEKPKLQDRQQIKTKEISSEIFSFSNINQEDECENV
jgi:hypothetical protein